VGEAAGDDVTDALGDGEPDLGRGPGLDALDGQQTQDLADEERVALGLVVQQRDQLRRGDLRRGQLDVRGDLALAQPAEREATGHRLACDVGQHRGQRLRGQRVDVAVGAEHEHPGRAELAGEEPQEQQRRRVCRMEVVQDEQDASISRSRETTRLASSSSAARSARCLWAPRSSARPFESTSSGPRMRKSIADLRRR